MQRRTEYRHEFAFYGRAWDVPLRTLKRWVAVGRTAGDPPPLDRPELLPAWWSRHYDVRIPDAILRAAGGPSAAVTAPAAARPAPADPESPPATAQPAPDLANLPLGPTGIRAMVERLRQAEARANALYLDALERRPEAAELCRKGWSELAEKLRAAERTAAEVLKTQGELVEWRAIEQRLSGIHQTVVSGVRALLGRWAAASSVNVTPAMEATWSAEVDRLFAAMREARFGSNE